MEPFILNLRKVFAFIKKDFLSHISYKMAFVIRWFGIFISIFTFYYLSKLIGHQSSGHLASYGGDYFPFILVGIAATSYIGTSLGSFASKISQEQRIGTLEMMLVTPTRLSTIIISLSLYSFIFATINVLIYLGFGCYFLGVDFSNANLPAALIILILTIISFSSIGIISASFIIVFKRGDPIMWAISGLSQLFGGVFFPVTIFPKYLQLISYSIPITYSLRSLRYALLKGYSLQALLPDILVLLVFSVILLPLSVVAFNWAVKRAKKAGTLAFY
ncbi:MAG: ABC transporter permease [Candidatus Omnitrophica bacterium]|nr:ABC transporter permease [Candidatus Omnitrophota bacterium]